MVPLPVPAKPIVHIGPASPFMSLIADVFEEAAPGQNRYLIQATSSGQTLHDTKAAIEFEPIPKGLLGIAVAVAAARRSRLVIVHGMPTLGAVALLGASAQTATVWSGWGGDYYGDDASRDAGLLDPLTSETALRLATRSVRSWRSLAKPASMVVRRRAARRANYFSAPIPNDFEVFRARFPEFAGRYAQINYATVEDTFSSGPAATTADDILIGNSASFANNHLDVFAVLAQHDLGGRRVIVPLSYGESDRYREAVVAAGRRAFGADFTPVLEYMTLEEYNALIARCASVIMGHHRQQALGNVATALSMGARVYLSSRNPTLAFLRERGVTLGTTDELAQYGIDPVSLDGSAVQSNRDAISEFWSRERVVSNAKAMAALAVSGRQ